MKILAICGSLRAASTNKTLLEAAILVGHEEANMHYYECMGDLPPFNPDLAGQEPKEVVHLKRLASEADAYVISTPEYAHGLPGSLKNLLDWMVTSGEMIYKPISILNPSPSSVFAQDQIREVLKTMDSRVIEEACLTISLRGKSVTAEELASQPESRAQLKQAIHELVSRIPASRAEITEKL